MVCSCSQVRLLLVKNPLKKQVKLGFNFVSLMKGMFMPQEEMVGENQTPLVSLVANQQQQQQALCKTFDRTIASVLYFFFSTVMSP